MVPNRNMPPLAIRSMIHLLAMLLLVQPVLSGCSMIGYAVGHSIDEDLARRTPVESVDEIGPNEPLVLTYRDGQEVEGWKLAKLPHDRLVISHNVMRHKTWVRQDTTVSLTGVVKVERQTFAKAGRLFFTTMGVGLDVLVVIGIIMMMTMGSPFSRAWS